jgi:hypothetical protein
MTSGSLTLTLRPLRLAFVVSPDDTKALFDAIRINSYVWGGQYNPIIPLFRKLPRWLGRLSRPASVAHLFASYLDLFDPDFVIRLGAAKDEVIDLHTLKEIPADEVLAPVIKCETPAYGIGVFEILEHLLHEEFRFVRRDSLEMRIPTVGSDLFLASVFGTFPEKYPQNIATGLVRSLSYSEVPCSVENYTSFYEGSNLFPRRICHQGLKSRKSSWWWGEYVFLLDAEDPNDILLYWNYRALGWNVLAVPTQAFTNEAVRKHVATFVEASYWPLRGNPSFYNHTTVLGSPNVSEQQIKDFVSSLNLKPVPQGGHGKTSLLSWLPRFWDEWARSKDGVDRCSVSADEQRRSIRIDDGQFEFEPLMPVFAHDFAAGGTPRCANQIELRIYGNTHEYAQVIPQGGDKLARAAHSYGIDDLRCSKDGMVFYPKFSRWTETMMAPSADAIFAAWFQERGWKVAPSDKGYIIKQLLRQLGGSWRMKWLTEEPVLRFLMEIPKLGPISEGNFRGRLNQLASKGSHISAAGLARWLVESNIVRLGVDVSCPRCRQRSWYSVTEVNYELACRQCLETYRLPSESIKEMPWAYRGAGAFGSKIEVIVREAVTTDALDAEASLASDVGLESSRVSRANVPDGLQGGLAVLLLLHSLSADMRPTLTPLLSFNASNGAEPMEVDLAVLTRHMRSGVHQDDVIFAECKSFHGRFERRDVQRMERFADQFPAAVVIFATLRRELDAQEKRLLIPFAKRGRKPLSATRVRNPVVIFTGNELFSWGGPRAAWRELGLPFSSFQHEQGDDRVFVSFADATQQLYLGLPSIHERPRRRGPLKR